MLMAAGSISPLSLVSATSIFDPEHYPLLCLTYRKCQVDARLLQDALWPPAVHVIIELVAAFVIGMGIAKAFQYVALRLKRTAQRSHRVDRHSAP